MSGMTLDSAEWKAFQAKLSQAITNIRAPMNEAGAIIRNGIEKQFTSSGSHWGTPWTPGGFMIGIIREWQGYNYDRNQPLIATGMLRRNWQIALDEDKVTVGSSLNYAANMHNGVGGTGTFVKKMGGQSKPWTHTWDTIPAREIIPVTNGLTDGERNDIKKAFFNHLVEAFKEFM